MAVKLFCDKCKEYIKDITPEAAARLSGQEVCKKCKDHVDAGLAEFNAAVKKNREKIEGFINKTIVELEEIRHRYLDNKE